MKDDFSKFMKHANNKAGKSLGYNEVKQVDSLLSKNQALIS